MFVRFSVVPCRAHASAWENAHRERHIAVDRIASRWKLDSHSLHTRWHPHWHHVSRPRHALHVQHERVAGEPPGNRSTVTESHVGGRCGASRTRSAGTSASQPRSPRTSGVSSIEVAKNCCGTAVSSGSYTLPESTSGLSPRPHRNAVRATA